MRPLRERCRSQRPWTGALSIRGSGALLRGTSEAHTSYYQPTLLLFVCSWTSDRDPPQPSPVQTELPVRARVCPCNYTWALITTPPQVQQPDQQRLSNIKAFVCLTPQYWLSLNICGGRGFPVVGLDSSGTFSLIHFLLASLAAMSHSSNSILLAARKPITSCCCFLICVLRG